jgi:hypothetical protein
MISFTHEEGREIKRLKRYIENILVDDWGWKPSVGIPLADKIQEAFVAELIKVKQEEKARERERRKKLRETNKESK